MRVIGEVIKNHASDCPFSRIASRIKEEQWKEWKVKDASHKITSIWNIRKVFDKKFNKIVRNQPGELEEICIPEHRNVDSFQESLLNGIEYRRRATKNSTSKHPLIWK